jgi:hypothetical protein
MPSSDVPHSPVLDSDTAEPRKAPCREPTSPVMLLENASKTEHLGTKGAGRPCQCRCNMTDIKEKRDDIERKEEMWESYKHTVNAMLLAAKFAETVTLSVVLTSGDASTTIPGIIELAYASSLFIGGIMGCIFILTSIESDLGKFQKWTVRIEVLIVGVVLFVAFYLLPLASSLFLSYQGPFILGSIIYIVEG